MRRLPRSCVVQAGWWQREPGGGEQAGTLVPSPVVNALRGAEAAPRGVGSDGAARAVILAFVRRVCHIQLYIYPLSPGSG